MAKVKKAQKGGCLSTTGSSTRTSLYKSAAGEGGSGSDRRAARQFARNERRMDKAAAKMEREEAEAKAKAAPKGKSGMKVKKAQTGKMVPSEMKPGKMIKKAAQDARTDKMAKALDKASVLGSKFKKPVAKKKNGGTVSMQLGSYDRQLGKNYSGKAKMGKSVGKCKYGC